MFPNLHRTSVVPTIGPVTLLPFVEFWKLRERRRAARLRRRCAREVLSSGCRKDDDPPDPPIRNIKESGCPNQSGCKMASRNGRLARQARRLLRVDQRLTSVKKLPPLIPCGQIRSAIRSTYPRELTLAQELSIKTASKLEANTCKHCASDEQEILREWKESRFRAASVDEDHLLRFRKAFAMNVDEGWDRKDFPFIPNGHASEFCTRNDGGNWVKDQFSSTCRVARVSSGGKDRIVTLYAGYNNSVLSRLHQCLYDSIRRKGWLLVGSPTNELVTSLNGEGHYISVDYRSATDNINAAYCRAAIEVIKEKAKRLTPEECRCLDVVGQLRPWIPLPVDMFDLGEDDNLESMEEARVSPPASTGQPMGSLISFPLLCLINKTVVDLSVADLASAGKMTWKEFRVHRCLINGDDLLYRELRSSHDIRAGILYHGSRVGLQLQEEKTMESPDWAEINSTAFFRGERRKKTNLGVLLWSEKVTDPIGFIADSVVRPLSFGKMLKKWARVIASTECKVQGPLPCYFFSRLRLVKDELCQIPSAGANHPNVFPVVPVPDGYDLSRGLEIATINQRVERLQAMGYVLPQKAKPEKKTCIGRQTIQSALRKRKPAGDCILQILSRAWEEKVKEKLRNEDAGVPELTTWAWDESSKVSLLLNVIRAFKEKVRVRDPGRGTVVPGDGVPFSRDDYVAFEA